MLSHEDLVKYRLECLKIAYEVSFKVGNLKDKYEPGQNIMKELQDVFLLADMNFDFIHDGILPSNDQSEERND